MLQKLILFLFYIGVLCACHTPNSEKVVRKVKAIQPQPVSGIVTRTFNGIVQTPQEISLGFRTPGQIKHVYVKEGEFVRKGQYIAELDDNDYQLQAAASRVQYDQAKKELGRLEKLHASNSIPGNDYEKAKAGVKALGIQLEADVNNLSYTVLKAPVDGYIQSVHGREAELVNAGTGVVTLLDAAKVRIEAELPASLYMQQEYFTGYTCNTYLIPDKVFKLQPINIQHKANSSQLYKMFLTPTDATQELKPGMNVDISIKIENPELAKGYVIPASAVFTDNGKDYVWIINQANVVQKREVITGGITENGEILITEGLSGNDRIVGAGVEALLENEEIQVIPESTASNVGGLL